MATFLQRRRILFIIVTLVGEVIGIEYFPIWSICGQYIYLGHNTDSAGEIEFSPAPPGVQTCEIAIENFPIYDISIKFGDDFQAGNCNYSLRIHNPYVNYRTDFGALFESDVEITAKSKNVTISFENTGCAGDGFYFKLIYSSFRNASSYSCNKYEVYCSSGRCIDRSIACLRYYRFCTDYYGGCSDIVREEPAVGANVIPLVVVPIIVAVVVYIVLSKMCGLHAKIKKCLGCEGPPRRRTPPLAVDVYTVRTTGDGDDSDTEAGPIDYTTYRDPPPYDSLEHLDRVTKIPEDDLDGKMEPPPDYSSVMMNQMQFKVSHM